jgi:hypothetical protein
MRAEARAQSLPITRRSSVLTKIPYAETREEAERQKRAFQTWATKKGVAAVGQAPGPRLGMPVPKG